MASFDHLLTADHCCMRRSAGVRVWQGQEEIVRKLGGPGTLFRRRLPAGNWRPWLVPRN
jgi:hypothetical protein